MDTNTIDLQAQLLDSCRKGDAKAQQELYRRYARNMYNICIRMVNHVGEAEDILQESFIEAFTRITDFRGESTFGAWLKRIVVNRCINYLRRRKLELVENLEESELLTEEPEHWYEQEEMQMKVEQVRAAIQLLPDGYRVVLSLYLLEGYDHAEIAQILEISESTSKSQYNRAKTKLRQLLIN